MPIGHTAFPGREIKSFFLELKANISRSVNLPLTPALRWRYFPVREIMVAQRTLTPADIASIVRRARKAQGLRQDELAGAAGVGLRFIVDLEAGKPTAQLGKALKVLETLGCRFEITPPTERKA